MSYDLMVYDPSITFDDGAEFLTWYKNQTKWAEDHGYNDPAVAAPVLQPWFKEMIGKFPPMNGPLASNDVDDAHVSDYCIGKSLIYIAFAWSVSQEAHVFMQNLAMKHKIGFFDITNDEVWGISRGEYRLLFKV